MLRGKKACIDFTDGKRSSNPVREILRAPPLPPPPWRNAHTPKFLLDIQLDSPVRDSRIENSPKKPRARAKCGWERNTYKKTHRFIFLENGFAVSGVAARFSILSCYPTRVRDAGTRISGDYDLRKSRALAPYFYVCVYTKTSHRERRSSHRHHHTRLSRFPSRYHTKSTFEGDR